jgi:hypothetical protein
MFQRLHRVTRIDAWPRFAALRVTPANEWRNRRLAPEVWLLCEQDLGLTPRIKHFFVHLPATASLYPRISAPVWLPSPCPPYAAR